MASTIFAKNWPAKKGDPTPSLGSPEVGVMSVNPQIDNSMRSVEHITHFTQQILESYHSYNC